MERIIYKVIGGYKGQEWITPNGYFKSKQRAEEALIKMHEMFGNATLLTLNRTEYGDELRDSLDYIPGWTSVAV